MADLTSFIVVAAGVLGLLIGSFLNVVAYRVPAGISLMRESRCPHCDAPIEPWRNVPVFSWLALRGRCASCREGIPSRYPIVEAFTGIAFACITWMILASADVLGGDTVSTYWQAWALGFVIIGYLYFAAISIVLTLIDLDTNRLPNSIVLPSYLVAGAIFTIASVFAGDWSALVRSAVGMIALYSFYFLLRVVRPGGMGGGDVKLAGVVGIYLGWIGWGALAVGAFAAFVYGGVFGIALILARRAKRKSAIPFGPWMLLGAWTGVFAGEAVGRWYGNLITGV